MRILVLAALAAVLAGPAFAATIRPSQAFGAQGELVVVEGTASVQNDSARAGTDLVLTGRDQSKITAFIPTGSLQQFPALDSYEGKTVNVSGVVVFNGGKPEIRLLRANQLKLASP